MSDREALLAAIRATPADDLPRLVYADWLEENGESLPPLERKSARDRAGFIRAQVEAARAESFSPAAREADERANHFLTEKNLEAWTWHLRGRMLETAFERGFIERATVDAAEFPSDADALFDAEPIRSIRVCRPNPRRAEFEVLLAPFFEVARLEQIASLDVQGVELQYDDCEKLAASPHLAGLTSLSLRGNPIFPPWFRGFVEGDLWPNLTGLDLADIGNLGPAIAAGFRAADHRRFKTLDLSGVGFRSEDLKRALGSECVSEVEELRLRWDGGSTLRGTLTHLELGWVIPWEFLRLLDLDGQGIGPEGVQEIARHERAANLRWLGLARNQIGHSGAKLLTQDSLLKPYFLDVRHNDLGAKDVLALKSRFPEAVVLA